MRNAGLSESQAGIKISRRNINNLRYADGSTLMAESEEELKSFLKKVKEENEKADLKLSIQKTKIVTSGPISSWQIDGEIMETVRDLFSWAPKSLQMIRLQSRNQKMLAPWKKSYDQIRQHIKKQRHYFADKGKTVKAMVFPVVMYGCESWTIKKAENERVDYFSLWCWIRLLRVLWNARRSNQSILKEISLGCSLERLMLELKLQYFGHLMRITDSLEKTLMQGKIEGGGEGDDKG